MKKLLSIMSTLQIHSHFNLDFHKVDQLIGCKYLIHGTETPQGQLAAKPGTSLQDILVDNLNVA